MSLDLSTNPYFNTNDNKNTENKSSQQQKNKNKKKKHTHKKKNKNKKKTHTHKKKQQNNTNNQSNNSNNSNNSKSDSTSNDNSKTLLNYYSLRDKKPVNYRKPIIHNYLDPGYNTDEELEKLYILEKQYPNYDTNLHKNETESDDCDLNQDNTNNNNNKIETDIENKQQSQHENENENKIKLQQNINNNDKMEIDIEIKNEKHPNEKNKIPLKKNNNQQKTENKSELKQEETAKSNSTMDENGICSRWSYDVMMENKQLLFNCKYRWNFCNSYFSNKSLDHIYDAPFGLLTNEQVIKYENMLEECIETVTEYHRNNNELIKQFKQFNENFRIQFSDSILLFDGMTEGNFCALTNEKGRSVRVGIFSKNNTNNNSNNNSENDINKVEMIVCYADNKQFVAECQQFFGIKINDFKYESRKWALSEDAAHSIRKGKIKCMNEWMDIGLIISISIINRLLNPSLPDKKRINSIYKQEIFDVTDLLPPFDDLKSLLKNDTIWWLELDKRLNTKDDSIIEKISNESGYNDGSLKDFIDDTIIDETVDIKQELNMIYGMNNSVEGDGMLNNYLVAMSEYNEQNDKDYVMGNGDDCEDDDFEKFIDQSIQEDVANLFDDNVDAGGNDNLEKRNIKKCKLEGIVKMDGNGDNEKKDDEGNVEDNGKNVNKKRSLDAVIKVNENDNDDSDELSSVFDDNEFGKKDCSDEPPMKKQKLNS